MPDTDQNSEPSAPSDWYLAQLRPNQQMRARTNLERQGYRCFCPTRPITTRRRGRLVPGLGPLFPGYLFLRIDPGQQWRPVNATYGVSRLVMRRPDMPQPVPEMLIADLFARTDHDGMIQPDHALAVGDVVRIGAGPMAGFMAKVASLNGPERVGLLLEMMGQAVRTDLPRAHLERMAG